MRTPVEPVELLRQLVRTESVSPEFGGCGELDLARLAADFLSAAGFVVQMAEVQPGRPNVIAYRRGTSERAIGFCTHLDNMSVGGMTIPPFDALIKDGCVWGRGSADPKASLAAMLCAIQHEVAANAGNLPSILVLLTVEEETSFEGARQFTSGKFPPLLGMIIGEPTALALVSAHKGALRADIDTAGVAAHSATPAAGVNAIYRMARVISRLEELSAQLAAREGHPLVGPPTLSVGTINGGIAVNTVPDHCTIAVDRRVLPGESLADVEAELRTLLAECEGASMDEPLLSVPGYAIDLNHPWAELVADALKQSAANYVPYATDASILQQAGIPCLIYGPGQIAAAHAADEHVSISEFLEAIDGYRAILRARV